MDTTIFYFSSTGNSLDVAKIISTELGSTLLPITKNIEYQCNSQNIGFVFPTYFWGLPHIVEEFIKKLVITIDNPYIFGIMMAKSIGGGLGSLDTILKEKGYTLNYGGAIQSVSNYIVAYDIEEVSISMLIKNARKEAVYHAQAIKMKKQNHFKKIPVLTDLFHKIYLKKIGDGDNKFKITDSCIGCGLCEKICPIENVELVDKKPVFKHKCEHCMACLHWCPKEAICYGNKTKKHHHYHNPNIEVQKLNRM